MTPPPVLIELLDSDGAGVLSSVRVHKSYLLPEGELEVVGRFADRVRLRLTQQRGPGRTDAEGRQLPDVPVGSVPVVTRNPDTDELYVEELRIPSPAPFSDGAIDRMWNSAQRLPEPVQNYVRRRGLWSAKAAGVQSASDLFAPSLPKLVSAARHLVRHWPQSESWDVYWRPVELAGGLEDARGTMRHLGQVPVALVGGRHIPTRTLRRRADLTPWRIGAVSVVATEVAYRVRMQGGSYAEELVAPLQAVADLARPRIRGPDPSPASWPGQMRLFHTAALEVLASVSAAGIGTDRAPLCHLWVLYEAWISESLLQLMESELGPPVVPPTVTGGGRHGPVWFSRWKRGLQTIELWSQPSIGGSGRAFCGNPDFEVGSVTAGLIPDNVVAVDGPGGRTLVLIDAKHRGNEVMDASDAAEAASKYLWGLRAVGPLAMPAPRMEVVLVSSGPPATLFSPEEARTTTVQAVPEVTELEDVVGAALLGL